MSTLSIRLPESLHNHLKKVSASDRVSINQFVASAVAEKIAAMEAESYLSERAKAASIDRFKEILAKVLDIEVDEQERA
jgi:hypothetical protein